MRYVVLDTSWDGMEEGLAGWKGSVLARFNTLDSAMALTLQRMAYGDQGVIVVDSVSDRQAFPREASLDRRVG